MTRKDTWLEAHSELNGVTLHHRKYFLWAANWDHDHCELCSATFLVGGTPWARTEHVTEGWTTDREYDWICDACFQKHRKRFSWKTREALPTDRPDTDAPIEPAPIKGRVTKSMPKRPKAIRT